VNADELFIVSRYLSRDVEAPSDPRCMIDIEKAKERDFYYDYIAGPHEGRFDIFNRDPFPLTQNKY
jgi:hypothetical protein